VPEKMYATGDDISTVMFDRRCETDWEWAATSFTSYAAATFWVGLAIWLPVVRARAEIELAFSYRSRGFQKTPRWKHAVSTPVRNNPLL
jgi:hypothetical protein